MANRAYLYSLSNWPTSFADRPETISGLSEWAYAIPFSYRVLMSGDPQLCASLVSDGFDGESADGKTRLHAISGDFDVGFARLKRFISVLRPLAASSPTLTAGLDETLAFLEVHRDRYLLLETIELDTMTTEDEAELRACVEREIAECVRAGAAIDALPADTAAAGVSLVNATRTPTPPPLDAFHGLRLDEDFDNVRGGNENPLGLEWSDVLYFELWNRAQFEANR
ncbi:MAG: hypothetical protein JSS02_10800 [Planctomycetes bacterium]|nr:hypothetical protein [Planctomycetota bacterium]